MIPFLPDGVRASRSFGFWQRQPLRRQVMAAVITINLLAALAAISVIVVNARRATEAEILSSLTVAERFVQETVDRLAGSVGGSASLRQLPLHISGLRHVRISIVDQNGAVLDIPAAATEEGAHAVSEVPGWFGALVSVSRPERIIPVIENGVTIGSVRVRGEAADEVAEVWSDMSDLAVLAFVVNIAILAALFLALGRLLLPLQTLSAGLRELETGRFEHRLPIPAVRELALIAARFNALGGALKAARDDNARLNERLIRVQDDERRQIAAELHDELGPCLFGLRANLESIDRLAARGPLDRARQLAERTSAMADILDRVQELNRRLLRRIRPMALGHVPLSDVVADLLADFERHAPDRGFALTMEGVAERYGDSVDITIYRCIQEAVTNALRHGQALNISVEVREEAGTGAIRLVITDDGRGVEAGSTPGFGFIGIEERIGALGGHWRIGAVDPCGTRVDIFVPVPAGETDETFPEGARAP
ncbi:histidine kinase [Ancylobacter amanitiformis]|uniref:Two-component system sensor histidine kinase UhpB n=1 Tax=Ancylobacter amanitiformis TaxID=217069 RepID=A0ABU0LS57_9HYPH|nr:histidine kinase [Ancylobacter amanitiformis]MDQ0511538.1 two-component system sensor histidine kinase UhpB [Ancylobacter amanitiformis]